MSWFWIINYLVSAARINQYGLKHYNFSWQVSLGLWYVWCMPLNYSRSADKIKNCVPHPQINEESVLFVPFITFSLPLYNSLGRNLTCHMYKKNYRFPFVCPGTFSIEYKVQFFSPVAKGIFITDGYSYRSSHTVLAQYFIMLLPISSCTLQLKSWEY